MKEEQRLCMEHLAKLRELWLAETDVAHVPNDYADIQRTKASINRIGYEESIYVEPTEEGRIIVFHLSRKTGWLASVHFCLGVLLSNNKNTRLLSNEDLWEYGIP